MNYMKRGRAAFLLVVIGAAALTGCQTIRQDNAKSDEQMLAAAGFQMKLAQTPEQEANIQAMQQRKLVAHVKDGQNMYVYADAEFCQCVYVGTEENYQQYQKMAFQKEVADEQQSAAEMNEAASMNWEVWGPWGPWL